MSCDGLGQCLVAHYIRVLARVCHPVVRKRALVVLLTDKRESIPELDVVSRSNRCECLARERLLKGGLANNSIKRSLTLVSLVAHNRTHIVNGNLVVRHRRRHRLASTQSIAICLLGRRRIVRQGASMGTLTQQSEHLVHLELVARDSLGQRITSECSRVTGRTCYAIKRERGNLTLVTHQGTHIVDGKLMLRHGLCNRLGLTHSLTVGAHLCLAIMHKCTHLDAVTDQGNDTIELQVVAHHSLCQTCLGA